MITELIRGRGLGRGLESLVLGKRIWPNGLKFEVTQHMPDPLPNPLPRIGLEILFKLLSRERGFYSDIV